MNGSTQNVFHYYIWGGWEEEEKGKKFNNNNNISNIKLIKKVNPLRVLSGKMQRMHQ